MFIIFSLLVLLITLIVVKLFIIVARHRGLLDIPNQRSSHVIPTPRGGGIVFVVMWLLILLFYFLMNSISLSQFLFLFAPSLLIAVISFIDDSISLSAKWRFLVQLVAGISALVFIHFDSSIDLTFLKLTWEPLVLLLLLFFIIWSVNLFNFMDGTDGIASVEALFVLGGQAYLLYQNPSNVPFHLVLLLCAAIFGFLLWNWPKAKVFMGDVGSATLGMIIALIAICLQKSGHVAIVYSLMLYGLFLFDATITLLRRLIRKEKVFQAHKLHAYQRLHQAGWSHLQVLLGFIAVNVLISVLTLIAYHWPKLTSYMVLLELLILGILYGIIERLRPMYPKHVNP